MVPQSRIKLQRLLRLRKIKTSTLPSLSNEKRSKSDREADRKREVQQLIATVTTKERRIMTDYAVFLKEHKLLPTIASMSSRRIPPYLWLPFRKKYYPDYDLCY